MALLMDEILSRAARVAPQRVAATLGDRAVTFGEAQRRATATANALAGQGVVRGDRVASWGHVSLHDVDLYMGTARMGAVYVPLNPAYTPEEADAVVGYVRPRALVADRAHQEPASAIARQHGIPLFVTGADDAAPVAGVGLEDLMASAHAHSYGGPPPAESDLHVIFLTSGSTGRPKGVMLTHRADWLRHFSGASLRITSGGGGELCAFPLFHMAGWLMSMLAWSEARPAHFVARADPDLLLAEMERRRPSTLYAIPAVWRRILDADGAYDTSSLRWALTGTSRVSPEFLMEIKERFPGSITTVAYGSTEAGSSARLDDADLLRRPYSVGQPAPGVEARLDDGELVLRTDLVMAGYFEMPEETAAALADGWYHTGDLAEIDDDGYISIVGRRSEMIRSGAEFVAPVEVEAVLAHFPGMVEVAVVGIPDDTWGEVVTAVVVLRDDAPTPSIEALRAHAGGHLAPFKHPRRVVRVERLPRTPATGQVQRAGLRRRVVAAAVAGGDVDLRGDDPPGDGSPDEHVEEADDGR